MYERTITYSKIELLSGTDIYQLCREKLYYNNLLLHGPAVGFGRLSRFTIARLSEESRLDWIHLARHVVGPNNRKYIYFYFYFSDEPTG